MCRRLIQDIDRSIRDREHFKDDESARERQQVYRLARPHIEHIQAPVDHDMELHRLVLEERDKGWREKARAADGIRMLPRRSVLVVD